MVKKRDRKRTGPQPARLRPAQSTGGRPNRRARQPLGAACPQASADVRDPVGHGAKSAVVRERAILALLSEKSIMKAAAKSGVNERTLRRWLADDAAFKAGYATARQTAFEAGMNRVQALMVRAVDTLADLLDAKTQPNVRLGAARTVAELGMHRHDADTIMRKLAEIETAQRQQGTPGTP